MKDDTISRAAAIDALNGLTDIFLNNLPPTIYKADAVDAIKAQPSATDTNVGGNLIDRGAALDALDRLEYTPGEWATNGLTMCKDAIKALPSAQPDVPDTNVGDMISRQAAINALKNRWKKTRNYEGIGDDIAEECELYLKQVLPTQPGQRNARVFQGIIVEYTTISTYPEYEGKPYFSIKYTENGQEFIGYGTYKPEVLSEYLKEYFMPPTQPGWIPVTERLPDVRQWVLCQCRAGIMDVLRLTADGSWNKNYPHTEYMSGFVVAWMSLPKPWKGDEQ